MQSKIEEIVNIYESMDLSVLATEAVTAANDSQRQLTSSVQNAVSAGRYLTAAKSKVAHGQWSKWLEDNWQDETRTLRTAQRYMTLASFDGDLSNVESLRDALNVVADAKNDTRVVFADQPSKSLTPVNSETIEKTEPIASVERKGVVEADVDPTPKPESTTVHSEATRKVPEAEKVPTQPVTVEPHRDTVKKAIEEFLEQQSAKWFFDEAVRRDPRLKPKVPTVPQLVSEIPSEFGAGLKAAAEMWVTHKQSLEGKSRIRSSVAWQTALKQMSKLPEPVVVEAIESAMTNGWTGWLQDSVKKQVRGTGAIRNQDVDNFEF